MIMQPLVSKQFYKYYPINNTILVYKLFILLI